MRSISFVRHVRIMMLEWMIIKAVPFLNRFRKQTIWFHSLDELRQFPSGTWGANLAQFLDSRGFNDFLPNYEAHDAIHTLLGYETNVAGELRLQAFMVGNGGASMAGRILFVLGCLLLPELWSQLRLDFRRGEQSPPIRLWDVPTMLSVDLTTLSSQIAYRYDLQTQI